MTEAVFYYEFSSPYSYFSAQRVDALMPTPVRWQPILLGALVEAIGKTPWSLQHGPARDRRMRECEAHAAELGLALRWPRDWPLGTYSVLAARAALAAERQGLLREFSLQAFHQGLGLGRDLTDLVVVLEAAEAAGADVDDISDSVKDPDIKEALRAATEQAVADGITGVPTIQLGDEFFWGNDRLADAAQAAAARETH